VTIIAWRDTVEMAMDMHVILVQFWAEFRYFGQTLLQLSGKKFRECPFDCWRAVTCRRTDIVKLRGTFWKLYCDDWLCYLSATDWFKTINCWYSVSAPKCTVQWKLTG
jgi:hypothetical protein